MDVPHIAFPDGRLLVQLGRNVRFTAFHFSTRNIPGSSLVGEWLSIAMMLVIVEHSDRLAANTIRCTRESHHLLTIG